MLMYENTMKVRDALQLFFSKYHFADGGYHLKWFKIKVGPIYIPLPNLEGRVSAAKIHDIHHVITEYPATLKGEAEISGWEIASGCGKYTFAWILNIASFFYGTFFFPIALYKAFMRGCKVKINLYHTNIAYETLLQSTVGELRQTIEGTDERKNSIGDYLHFVLFCLFTLTLAFSFFYILFTLIALIINVHSS